MVLCDRERAATQYAMLTATFGLTRAIASKAGGYIAQYLGYPTFFWSTVFFGIPALFLLLLVRGVILSDSEGPGGAGGDKT